MTKKDFELIAGVVADAKLRSDEREELACLFVSRLTETNARFNAEVFKAACLASDPGTSVGAKAARIAATLTGEGS